MAFVNVLIVDDQMDVAEGIAQGIDWKLLNVGHVYTAYSAADARMIFDAVMIQALLCDIEMPEENGIELTRWVTQKYPYTKCIFLTSHAEFGYAQEALKLGSFDYILQPAPYEEIVTAIKHALESFEEEENGRHLKQRKNDIACSTLRDFLLNIDYNVESFIKNMKRLGFGIDRHTQYGPMLIHIHNREEAFEGWDGSLLQYALNNILAELLQPLGYSILIAPMDENHYAIATFSDGPTVVPKETVDLFLRALQESLGGKASIYVGSLVEIDSLSEGIQKLQFWARNNVARSQGVFQIHSMPGQTLEMNISHWGQLMSDGYGVAVCLDAKRLLQGLADSGALSVRHLQIFHQEFSQLFFAVACKGNTPVQDVFSDTYTFQAYMQAHESLEQMYEFLDYAAAWVEKEIKGEQKAKNQIEKIVEFIHANLDRELSRQDVAEYAYLNPTYLSRMFKKEMGCSLNQFITNEKIKLAQTLLGSTAMPVSAVALKVGYTNFAYFAQIFKRVTGMTPNAYRHSQGKPQ